MRYNIALLSSNARQIERLQAALAADCVVMPFDPRRDDPASFVGELTPDAIIIDVDVMTGTSTVLERVAELRGRFPDRPLIAFGDEMSAQLILAAFRAGADEFLDREAADSEIHRVVSARLRERTAMAAERGKTTLLSVLSPAFCEEDNDLALNLASAIAIADRSRRVLLVDLSLPASPARTALGLEFGFTVSAAIQEMGRLDRTFLDAALAYDSEMGLRVIPLSDGEAKTEMPAVKDLAMLLQILRANFDAVVVYWGPFSHQALRAGADGDHLFVCCNQRFSSIRNAKAFVAELRAGREPADPVLAIYQLDTAMVPAPDQVAEAVGTKRFLALRANWHALAMAHNRGRPLVLGEASHYSDALNMWLAAEGLLPQRNQTNTTVRLMQWLRRRTG